MNSKKLSPDNPKPCGSKDNEVCSSAPQQTTVDGNEDLFTSSELLLSISPLSTKLVEIYAIVNEIYAIKTVKCKDGTMKPVLLFNVHNNNGERVQFIIWDRLIDKFIDKIHTQHIIHIDGVYPKDVKDQFNTGTVPYELVFQSSTIVQDHGKSSIPYSENIDDIDIVPLNLILKKKKIIKIHGYIKTNFNIIEHYTGNQENTCFGSIADLGYFIDVKITDFPPNFKSPFMKGEHIECIGSVIKTANSFHFAVKSIAFMKKIDSLKLSFKELLFCKPLSNDSKSDSQDCKRRKLY